jgi:nicotinate-nucleotide adenylyltransferase
MERIGIFGGSFNPVHLGHVNIARSAIRDLSLDRLYVMPAAVSPFKQGVRESAFDRMMLVRAAFNGMEKVTVDGRELARGGVSYAIDTVRELKGEHPGSELFFIIGEDSVEGLPRWKDVEELERLCEFKAYPRTRESSTEVRRCLAAGEEIGSLVPADVELLLRHKVVYNRDNPALADAVLAGLARKGGYCPCRLAKSPENFCICSEFKSQLADENFHGLCHCRLYQKP